MSHFTEIKAKKYISPSSPVFCRAKYRGGVRKDGGVNKNGGASWFVLLAAEKNEQITQISATETIFGRERKLLVSNLLPLPCPEALRGVVQENIGEN